MHTFSLGSTAGKMFIGLWWHHGWHTECEFMVTLLIWSILLFNIYSLLACFTSGCRFFLFFFFHFAFFFLLWFAVKMCKMYALHRSELDSSRASSESWKRKSASTSIWGFGCRSKGQNVINVRTANNRRSNSILQCTHTPHIPNCSSTANETFTIPKPMQYIIHVMHSLYCPIPYLCAFRFPCTYIKYGWVHWRLSTTNGGLRRDGEQHRWSEHCIPDAYKMNEIMYSFLLFCIFPISFWLSFYYTYTLSCITIIIRLVDRGDAP